MQEWLNWTVSKTVVAQVTVGSNPTLSANFHFLPFQTFAKIAKGLGISIDELIIK